MTPRRAASAHGPSTSTLGNKIVLAHLRADGDTVDRMVVLGEGRGATVESLLTTIEGQHAVEKILAKNGGTVLYDAVGDIHHEGAPIKLARKVSPQDQSAGQTDFLITALGSGAELARLLGVNRSQPTNWRSGKERPGSAARRNLLDLYYVMAKALEVFPTKAALDWLNGSNAYLDGARPIDVLRSRGSREVVQALEVALA